LAAVKLREGYGPFVSAAAGLAACDRFPDKQAKALLLPEIFNDMARLGWGLPGDWPEVECPF
jgi:hypothetical protein